MQDDVSRLLSAISIEAYIGRYVSLKRKGENYLGLCPFHSEKTPSFTVSPSKGIFKCFGCDKGGNVITFLQEYEGLTFVEVLKLLADYAGITLNYAQSNPQAYSKKQNQIKDFYQTNEWANRLFCKALKNDQKAWNYLVHRKLQEKTILDFSLGYSPSLLKFLETHLEKEYPNNLDSIKKELHHLTEVGLISHSSENTYNRFQNRIIFPIYNTENKLIGFGGRIIEDNANMAKYINSPDSMIYYKKKIYTI